VSLCLCTFHHTRTIKVYQASIKPTWFSVEVQHPIPDIGGRSHVLGGLRSEPEKYSVGSRLQARLYVHALAPEAG
jgi:hypothetical protein